MSRTNAFFLGGGKALVNAYYETAEKMGVRVEYETEVRDLNIADGVFRSAVVDRHGQTREVAAKAFIGASGGFEANVPWLKEYWGEAAENFIIRGTPYNKGRVLRQLLDSGARPVGHPKGFHAIALDARAPKFDGGIVTRLDSVPFGIVVNKHAERFYDEGEDFWPKRYAIWGTLIAGQPEQEAYSIVDAKSIELFLLLGLPRPSRPTPSGNWACPWTSTLPGWRRPCRPSTAPSNREPSMPPFWTIAPRTVSSRPRATGRGPSTPRRSTVIRYGPGSPSLISASP